MYFAMACALCPIKAPFEKMNLVYLAGIRALCLFCRPNRRINLVDSDATNWRIGGCIEHPHRILNIGFPYSLAMIEPAYRVLLGIIGMTPWEPQAELRYRRSDELI